MKLKKTEMIILVIIVLSVISYFSFTAIGQKTAQDDRARFEAEHQQAYGIGQTITLDSSKEDATISADGRSYSAEFAWNGTMELTVTKVRLCSSAQETGLPVKTYGDEFGVTGYLVVDYTLKNIDAVPKGESASGIPAFYNPVGAAGGDSIAYFSGGQDPSFDEHHDELRFLLEPGQTKDFTVVIPVFEGRVPTQLQIGTIYKYYIPLDNFHIDEQSGGEDQ